MSEVSTKRDAIGIAQRSSELARQIDQLAEPYRSNTIDWLEEAAGWNFSELARDLPRYLMQMQPQTRARCLVMLEALMQEAGRYFGAGRCSGEVGR